MKQKKEPQEVVWTGKLTRARFEQICEEQGYVPKTAAAEIGEAPMDSIFSGHLDIEKLKELCYLHLDLKSDSDKYDPRKNTNIVTLEKLEDGSWCAYKVINNNLLKTRELIPEHALLTLLTHA